MENEIYNKLVDHVQHLTTMEKRIKFATGRLNMMKDIFSKKMNQFKKKINELESSQSKEIVERKNYELIKHMEMEIEKLTKERDYFHKKCLHEEHLHHKNIEKILQQGILKKIY